LIATCDRVNIAVAAPSIMREYGWNTTQMGWALSAFYLGYVVFMIPSGILADLWGPKRTFGYAVGCWSLFTAMTPLPRGLAALCGLRALMGVGESATVPSIGAVLARWFPPSEYSRASGFAWSGGYAGSVLAFPLASVVLRYWGWRAIFYVFAGLGAVWLLCWWQRASNLPEKCPSIDSREMEYIVSSRPLLNERKEIPWKLILAAPAAWAVFLLHFSSNWFTYFLISWLPTYLQQARHFSIQNMAVASALPFLCALLGTNVSGFFIDRLSLTHNRTRISKLFLLSLGGAGGILVLLCHVSSPRVVVLLFCLAALLMTGATPVYASGALNLVPGSAGSFVGVQNTVANVSGILAPVITGYLAAKYSWTAAFSATAAVCCIGVVAYLLMGSAQRGDGE
jgi:sugar phosphate permease